MNFRTVDPFNEPSSDWWKANGGQEGCHIDAGIQRTVLAHLRTELDRQGLTGVGVSASDETSYDLARTTWNSFDAATKGLVRQVNVHGYQGGERPTRPALQRHARRRQGALELRDRRQRRQRPDHGPLPGWTWLHPTAWCYWQVMDPSAGWAAIPYNGSSPRRGATQVLRAGPVHPAHPARHADPEHRRRLRRGRVRRRRAPAGDRRGQHRCGADAHLRPAAFGQVPVRAATPAGPRSPPVRRPVHPPPISASTASRQRAVSRRLGTDPPDRRRPPCDRPRPTRSGGLDGAGLIGALPRLWRSSGRSRARHRGTKQSLARPADDRIRLGEAVLLGRHAWQPHSVAHPLVLEPQTGLAPSARAWPSGCGRRLSCLPLWVPSPASVPGSTGRRA